MTALASKKPKGARGSALLRVLRPEEARAHAPQNDRAPCPGLWKTPVIRWDGQLMACCADVDGEIPLGNLKDATFEELWFGPTMTEYRLLHIEGRFGGMPKCEECGGINFYKMDDDEVRAFLDENGRMDLWDAYRERMGRGP